MPMAAVMVVWVVWGKGGAVPPMRMEIWLSHASLVQVGAAVPLILVPLTEAVMVEV